MKILLDECVPVQIRDASPEHEVHSATHLQWRGMSNGQLLWAAEQEGFQLIIVADKNMRHQQITSGREIAILELWTNHRPTLGRKYPYISAAVERIQPGQYVELTAPISLPSK